MTVAKAVDARTVVLLDPHTTSKLCSHCGELVTKKLSERTLGIKRIRYAIPATEVRRIRAMLDEEQQGNSYGLAVSA